MLFGTDKKNEKKKRFSETKGQPNEYKLVSSMPKHQQTHQRSSSMSRNKKLRLYTEYLDDEPNYHLNHSKHFKPIHQKRRDHFEISQNIGKNLIVQSTKSNQKRNFELNNLFKNENGYESKKKYVTNKIGNHPLLKFVSNKNK
eukprot:GHVR01079497.1.p1 GENE.GHVR01079497.1~~GHVR01079497.1.p1  ORF type:complete len:143 (-),score=6.71 GHVR01079497.1:2881-3309(-)